MATIHNLGFNIFSRYSGDGVRQARNDLQGMINDHNRFTQALLNQANQQTNALTRLSRSTQQLGSAWRGTNREARSLTSGMGTMRAAMIGLAPAMLPLIEFAGALAGSFVAMGIAVGGAVGVYAAVGNAAAKMAMQLDAAGKKLTPMQAAYVKAVDGMRAAWKKLVTETGEKTLQPQIEVIKGLTVAIGKLGPVIDAIHPVIMKVAKATREWLEGTGFERFRDNIIKYGVPAFDRLQQAGRNALAALGIAFRTFLPETEGLSKAILKISEAFRNWAEGGGFQRFLDRTRETGPQVRQVLEALWQVFTKIIDVMRVLAPYAMAAAVAIAQFIASIPTPVLAAIVGGFIALRVALGALFGPLRALHGLFGSSGLSGALTRVLPLLGKVAGPLGLIATAVALAWKHSKFFRDALKELGGELKELWEDHLSKFAGSLKELTVTMEPLWRILGQVAGFILGAFAYALKFVVFLLGEWIDVLTKVVEGVNWFWQNIGQVWEDVWDALKHTMDTIVDAMGMAWRGFLQGMKVAWDAVQGAFVTAWQASWNAIKLVVEYIWDALKIAWEAVVNSFQTAWTTVSTALSTAWSTVWNAVKVAAETVWNALKVAWGAVVNAFQTVWTTVSTALSTAWSAVWNAIKVAAETVWNALKIAWDAFINGLQVIWTTVSTALSTAWSTVWNAIKTAAEAVWNALKIAWDAFINGLQTIWNTVSTALSTAWSTVWNAIRTAAETVWNALRTAWEAFVNALQTAWNTVSSALQAAWQTVWNALQTAAQTVWNALQTAWQTFLNAVQTAWTTVSSALQTAWQTVWNALQTAAQTVWTALQTAWQTFLNAVQTAWNTVSAALRTAWETVWNAIKTAAETVWNALRTAWETFLNAVRTIWNTISSALKTAWETFWNGVRDFAKEVWDRIREFWDSFTNGVREVWDTFSSAFETAWRNTWNTVKDIAQDIWTSIGGIIEKAVHGVIDVINGLIRGFNRITEFLEINVTIGQIDKPQFPGLADGGVVMFKSGGLVGSPCGKKGCGQGFALGGPVNLRRGGTLSGYAPGRDTVPAVLSRGEGVLTPEAVRGLGGPGFVNSANRQFAGHRGAGRGAGPLFRPSVPFSNGEAFATGGMVQHFAVGGMTADALARAGVPLGLVTQGEYSDGALSAGTHLGGGVVDLGTTDPAVLSRLIAAGFAAWIRGPENGMSPHIHAVLMNHPDLSGPARAQVSSFLAGGSGLGSGGGGGGGGIDIVGMISPHIGKILLNVYRGLAPLSGIAGTIATLFGGGGGGITPDAPDGGGGGSASQQARKNELMNKPRLTEAEAKELADLIGRNGSDSVLDRDSLMIQPAPFTGRPPINAGRNAGDIASPNNNSLLANLAKFVLPLIKREHISTALGDAKSEVDGFNIGGGFADIAKGFGNKLINDVIPDYVMKKAEAATLPTLTMGGGGNVQQWAGLAAEALARAGLSSSQLGAFLALMQAESGGDPNAINTTDINARNGNPSQGLMQVTGSTFAAYRDPSLPNNPRDPLANMVAAARYIMARYGGQVPGSPYADGTSSATPGLHLVGEEGPELVGLNGPMMAAFSGGQSVLPASETASLLNPSTGALTGALEGTGSGLHLPEDETQELLNKGGFEAIGEAAQNMADVVKQAWLETNTGSATQWAIMRDTTMTEAVNHYGADMPAASLAMQTASNAAWLDMNLQSATQWVLMRDTTFTEAEFHQGTQMPLMTTTMQTAWNAAWLDMQVQSTTQWTAMRDGVFLPMEEHMGVTMVTNATTMNEEVSAAFTAMGETITTVLDAGIAKMDEFIAKAQEAIEVTAELVAAVQEAQAAMASMASMGTGAAGGTAGAGVSGNVESWRAMALEAMAAGGLDTSQIDAFLALMQAESSGNPNAVNNWDSNAAAGTPSMGLMQMIQPTFDAHNVTGGNIMDPFANMAASAAYIRARYGGVVPGSPYENGTPHATPGLHLVGESGPELVGMNGPEFAWFRGGERVLTNEDTAAVLAQQALIPTLDMAMGAIDQFISVARAAIERAKALTAAALAARTAVGAMGSGPCTLPAGVPITQGPNNPGGVAASAGTHDGGGVYDFGSTDPGVLAQLHASGWAAWIRGNGDGMSPHIHAVCMSAPDLSPQAAWQVQDFQRGGSGLGIPGNLYSGTNSAQRGWSWVGEKGPELMWMRGGEKVMPNGDSMRWMSQQGGPDLETRIRQLAEHLCDEVESVHSSAGDGECLHLEFNFNGPVTSPADVRRAADEAIPKLRSAVQAGSGSRRVR